MALADTSVTIKGRTYVVKRNMVTIASQDPFEAWAIVKDGQTLSCKRATVESCEKALQGEESGGGGDY